MDFLENLALKIGFKKNPIGSSTVAVVKVKNDACDIFCEIIRQSNLEIERAIDPRPGYGWDFGLKQIKNFLEDPDLPNSEVIVLPVDARMYRVLLIRSEKTEKQFSVRHVDLLPKGSAKEFKIQLVD